MMEPAPDAAKAPAERALVIYDGECIFCSNYVQMLRLQKSVGQVELLDARSGDERIAQYWRQGLDLNEGMIFVHKGTVYHGADAVSALALLSTRSSVFNVFNRAILSNRTTARLIYPALRLGRNITLKVRGRHQMKPR
jgi:predicted DCC family thiol-disulfide oxidoreductase YuxK